MGQKANRSFFKFTGGNGVNPPRPPDDTAAERAEKQRLINDFVRRYGYTRVEIGAAGVTTRKVLPH